MGPPGGSCLFQIRAGTPGRGHGPGSPVLLAALEGGLDVLPERGGRRLLPDLGRGTVTFLVAISVKFYMATNRQLGTR